MVSCGYGTGAVTTRAPSGGRPPVGTTTAADAAAAIAIASSGACAQRKAVGTAGRVSSFARAPARPVTGTPERPAPSAACTSAVIGHHGRVMSITSIAQVPLTRRAPRRRDPPFAPLVGAGTCADATPVRRPRTRKGTGGTCVARPAASSRLAVSRPFLARVIAAGRSVHGGRPRRFRPATGAIDHAAPTRRGATTTFLVSLAGAMATSANGAATLGAGAPEARPGAKDGAPVSAPVRGAAAIHGRPRPLLGRGAPLGRNGAPCIQGAEGATASGVGRSYVTATRLASP